MSWERVKPLSENRRIRIMAHDFRTVADAVKKTVKEMDKYL